MICPKCGAELTEQESVCPKCGAAIEPAAETPQVPETPKTQKKPFPVLPVIIVALVVVIGVLVALLGSKAGQTQEPSQSQESVSDNSGDTVSTEDAQSIQMAQYTEASLDGAVAACEAQGFTLTNQEFNYYYWGEYYYLLAAYGSQIYYYIDTTQPLEDQMFDEVNTWQDYMLECAIGTMTQTRSLCAEAEKNGFELPEADREDLEATFASLQSYADQYEYESIDAYIAASYGDGADFESFSKYLEDSYLASAYTDYIYNNISATDADIEAYYDDHAEQYQANGIEKDDTRAATVRHILKAFEADEEGNVSDEEKEATREVTQAIYDSWQKNGGTEEVFNQLAVANSDDTTASNGGLLQDLLPGQTVTSFNDWVFADDREPGDSGMVESEYGWHIIYFVEHGELYWRIAATSDYYYETLYGSIDQIVSGYEYTVDKSAITILLPDDVAESYVEKVTE